MWDKSKCRSCLLYRCSCKIITSQYGYQMAIWTNALMIVNRLSYKPSILYFTEFSLTGYGHHIAHYRGQRANPSITKKLMGGRPLDRSRTLFNPLRAKFFRGNIKHIFTFHVIPLHWYDTGDWNPSPNKTTTCQFYIVNIMAAGVLATQGARTSAAMILN